MAQKKPIKKAATKKVVKKPAVKRKTKVDNKVKAIIQKVAGSKTVRHKNDATKEVFTLDNIDYELTHQQERFALEYIKLHRNGTKAAIAAGYAVDSARVQACRLLANDNIRSYISYLQNNLAAQLGLTAYDIAKRFDIMGKTTLKAAFDKDGKVLNIKDIDDEAALAIGSIEIEELWAGYGNDRIQIGWTKKFKMRDAVQANNALAKMLGVEGVTKIAAVDAKGKEASKRPTTITVKIKK